MTASLLAAVDLGSNSFRLEIGRVESNRVVPIDTWKETLRFGAGVDAEGYLDAESCARAIAALARFGERLRGFRPEQVRAVGTNALRVARNAAEFLPLAERALGFPIEIVAGREEARLIYAGVSHTLPDSGDPRLIVDIGGGSTEFILGRGFEPELMESVPIGCVGHSFRHFPEGRFSAKAFSRADLAARSLIEGVVDEFSSHRWQAAFGSSGTARALAEILEKNAWSDEGITRPGLTALRQFLIQAGDLKSLLASGLLALKTERAPVLAGGLVIMEVLMDELGIGQILPAGGAMRLGVLYDLLGRSEHSDLRETTVRRVNQRYGVDAAQARRVSEFATALLTQLEPRTGEHTHQRLRWAASWHEIGRAIAHDDYHKHGSYVLEHADLPGFSTGEQRVIGQLVLGQRGSLKKVRGLVDDQRWRGALCALRLAVIFAHARRELALPPLSLRGGKGLRLSLPATWLEEHPLTAYLLEGEAASWRGEGVDFRLDGAAA
ncbi:exopolyphosphatase / guanosine-5'-triphosphate,3'-diphosphate pyrophosphatase [Burkholderiales bacterium]|nr:MAG: Ppx/GppA family phosphatase [Burkholderiales bacterium]CAG1003131.1 exopolyphosphatase / guanosine-5'-triphosphate,3'-diphosphate pyrophosphatase [Burkholderiales bacterium]